MSFKPLQDKKNAMIEWSHCQTVEDVVNWHKKYTPWFDENQRIIIANSYWTDHQTTYENNQEESKDEKQHLQKAQKMSEMEKLFIKSCRN